MNKEEREEILRFINRGKWRTYHGMANDQWGNIDMGHPDNVERIRQLIADAKSEADALRVTAEEVERIMDMDMILHLRT